MTLTMNSSIALAINSVPMFNLTRQLSGIADEINEALQNVTATGQFVLGPEVSRLEDNIAAYSRTKHAIGCASGSDALLLSLMAIQAGKGDEIITPSFTFFSTGSCVPRVGADLVFADIDPVTFNLDPESVKAKLTEKTKAIIVVHLFGQAADMPAFQKIAKDYETKYGRKLYIIEDSAQAIGAEYAGIQVGNWGDASCLSFYPTKNLGGAGDGGMVVCNSDEIAERIRLLRGHGMPRRYYHSEIGVNSRLDSYQAAVLNVKLPRLDAWTQMRIENAERYELLFAEAGLQDAIVTPEKVGDRRHVWNQYCIRVTGGRRDALRSFLRERNIGSDIYYPFGLHEQECLSYLGYKPEDLPETYRASREVLALPIFPELTPDEQYCVVDAIREFMS
ncbi:MAG: DegT/DnrJ/EryC1/StrS family aminotransferase [Thermoguttaceae bacterium]|jgi:dTDP-4-amino-4,6-dideoxygalactose transaminase